MSNLSNQKTNPRVDPYGTIKSEARTVAYTPLSKFSPKTISPVIVDNKEISVLNKTDYRPEYAEKMLAYFTDTPKENETFDTITFRGGATIERPRSVPNAPPLFSKFAREIGVTTRRLKIWAKAHADFAEAYEECGEIIKEFIIDHGVTGKYSSAFTIFAAKNLTDMKDKVIREDRKVNVNKLLDTIQAARRPEEQSNPDDIYEREYEF